MVIICGTVSAVKFPGIPIPPPEHQQSGKRHFRASQAGAPFASRRVVSATNQSSEMSLISISISTSRERDIDRGMMSVTLSDFSPHHPSSEASGQSTLPSQKYAAGRHVPSPQANFSRSHWPFSSNGFAGRVSTRSYENSESPFVTRTFPWIFRRKSCARFDQGLWFPVPDVTSQSSTFALKSHICLDTSKRSPCEHLNSNTSSSETFDLRKDTRNARTVIRTDPYRSVRAYTLRWPSVLRTEERDADAMRIVIIR